MKTDFQTSQGLMDIDPPLAPPISSLPTVIIVLVLTILFLTFVIFAVRHFKSNRARALRKLRRLRKQSTGHDTNCTLKRDTAFQLAHTMSLGLNINGVTTNTALPAELNQHKDRWQKFMNNLSQCRFAIHTSAQPLNNKMLDDAYFWLKNWP